MIYTSENKWDEAENEFRESLKASPMALEKWLTPRIEFRYSEMLLKKGEPEQAHQHLEKALSEFERMGMRLWEGRARDVLAGLE